METATSAGDKVIVEVHNAKEGVGRQDVLNDVDRSHDSSNDIRNFLMQTILLSENIPKKRILCSCESHNFKADSHIP